MCFPLSLILSHILWADESDPPCQGCQCVSNLLPRDTHEVSSRPRPRSSLSQRQATQLPGNPALPIMDINLDFLKPVYELVQNEEVQKKLDETARLYWSPVSLT